MKKIIIITIAFAFLLIQTQLYCVSNNKKVSSIVVLTKSNNDKFISIDKGRTWEKIEKKDYSDQVVLLTKSDGSNHISYDNGRTWSEITKNEDNDKSSDEVIAFPNPVDNILNIKLKHNDTKPNIYLFDSFGRLVEDFANMEFAAGEISLSLRHLPQGSYLLQVNNEDKIITRLITIVR